MAKHILTFFMSLCLTHWSVVNGLRTATHKVTGICQRDPDQQTMSLFLAIDMVNDKPGEWRAIDANNGVVPPGACNIDVAVNPALISVINTNSNTENSMGCGFRPILNAQFVTTDFVWKIRYREGPEEKYEVDAGKNRLWTITCSATSQTNKITATISVTTPNLDQTVVLQKPLKKLEAINVETGEVIGTTVGIEVGKGYRLRATFDVSSLPSPKPLGAWVTKTIMSSSSAFNADLHDLLDEDGCKLNNIFSPDDNFKLKTTQSSTNIFVLETGVAIAWKYDTTQDVHFKAIHGYCFTANHPACTNPCQANSGARRRRDATVDHGDAEEVVLTIRVYDRKETAAITDLENDVLISVSVVGGVLLFLLILATCFIAIRVWRRKRRSNCQKVPPEGFENKGHIRY